MLSSQSVSHLENLPIEIPTSFNTQRDNFGVALKKAGDTWKGNRDKYKCERWNKLSHKDKLVRLIIFITICNYFVDLATTVLKLFYLCSSDDLAILQQPIICYQFPKTFQLSRRVAHGSLLGNTLAWTIPVLVVGYATYTFIDLSSGGRDSIGGRRFSGQCAHRVFFYMQQLVDRKMILFWSYSLKKLKNHSSSKRI